MSDHVQIKSQNQNKKGGVKSVKTMALKKVDLETQKLILSLKDKINKKPFGRKIRESEILALAVRQVSQEHIKQLQESTYSERDRLAMAHEEYQKNNGKITLDQFIGKLLNGDVRGGSFISSESSRSSALKM